MCEIRLCRYTGSAKRPEGSQCLHLQGEAAEKDCLIQKSSTRDATPRKT